MIKFAGVIHGVVSGFRLTGVVSGCDLFDGVIDDIWLVGVISQGMLYMMLLIGVGLSQECVG